MPTNLKIRGKPGFTLMELMVVIGIIVFLAAMAVPAIRSLSKGNSISQATNLVRSMVGAARSIAISQHRQAGVVIFEETTLYAQPANASQTALQLFVEDYNQQQYAPVAGVMVYVPYSSARQYLPSGVRMVNLQDLRTASGLVISDTSQDSSAAGGRRTRAILFDANGQLLLRAGLATPDPNAFGGETAGQYPKTLGDWMFLTPIAGFPATLYAAASASTNSSARSGPGFFLFNQAEFDTQFPPGNTASDQARSAWLGAHADAIIVNVNTGTVVASSGAK